MARRGASSEAPQAGAAAVKRTNPNRRVTVYNPALRRHSWHKDRDHWRDCLYCGIDVENVQGDRGAWWQRWTYPNGTGGNNHPGLGKLPDCPGPVMLHLGDRVGRALWPVAGQALIAACDLVTELAADRPVNSTTSRTVVVRATRDVIAARQVIRRAAATEDRSAVALSPREAASVARVATRAVEYWATNQARDEDGTFTALALVMDVIVVRGIGVTVLWPADLPAPPAVPLVEVPRG